MAGFPFNEVCQAESTINSHSVHINRYLKGNFLIIDKLYREFSRNFKYSLIPVPQRKHLLLFCFYNHFKMIMYGFWTISQTKQDICR